MHLCSLQEELRLWITIVIILISTTIVYSCFEKPEKEKQTNNSDTTIVDSTQNKNNSFTNNNIIQTNEKIDEPENDTTETLLETSTLEVNDTILSNKENNTIKERTIQQSATNNENYIYW